MTRPTGIRKVVNHEEFREMVKPPGKHLARPDFNDSAAVLKGNTFAILSSQGSIEDQIGRLLALIPMSLTIVEEARDTIARLRDENEALRRELEEHSD